MIHQQKIHTGRSVFKLTSICHLESLIPCSNIVLTKSKYEFLNYRIIKSKDSEICYTRFIYTVGSFLQIKLQVL